MVTIDAAVDEEAARRDIGALARQREQPTAGSRGRSCAATKSRTARVARVRRRRRARGELAHQRHLELERVGLSAAGPPRRRPSRTDAARRRGATRRSPRRPPGPARRARGSAASAWGSVPRVRSGGGTCAIAPRTSARMARRSSSSKIGASRSRRGRRPVRQQLQALARASPQGELERVLVRRARRREAAATSPRPAICVARSRDAPRIAERRERAGEQDVRGEPACPHDHVAPVGHSPSLEQAPRERRPRVAAVRGRAACAKRAVDGDGTIAGLDHHADRDADRRSRSATSSRPVDASAARTGSASAHRAARPSPARSAGSQAVARAFSARRSRSPGCARQRGESAVRVREDLGRGRPRERPASRARRWRRSRPASRDSAAAAPRSLVAPPRSRAAAARGRARHVRIASASARAAAIQLRRGRDRGRGGAGRAAGRRRRTRLSLRRCAG